MLLFLISIFSVSVLANSEISSDFVIGEEEYVVARYVPPISHYFCDFIWVVVGLIVFFFLLKMKPWKKKPLKKKPLKKKPLKKKPLKKR